MARKGMLDVGEDQLLVLLLMGEAEFKQRRKPRELRRIGAFQQFGHGAVDMAAIAGDGLGRRPADQAALGPRLPLAERLVIGIEQVVELRIEHRVARQIRLDRKSTRLNSSY